MSAVASAVEPAKAGATMCVIARVGTGRFAFGAADVEEVVDAPDLIPVPNAPEGLAGQFSHRERTISAFDGGWAFGVRRTRPARESAVLVLRVSGDRLALLVDDVEDLASFDAETVRPVPPGVDPAGVLTGVQLPRAGERTLVGVVNALTVALRAWTLAPQAAPDGGVVA